MKNQKQKGISSLFGIIIVIVIGVVVCGGILAYYYLWQPQPAVSPTSIPTPVPLSESQTLTLQLKSSDGFSIQIYDNNQKLIKNISRQEIINKFKEKYIDVVESPYMPFISQYSIYPYYGETSKNLEVNKNFIYDPKQNRIIIPLSLEGVGPMGYVWDFFVYNIESNQFSIVSGSREELHPVYHVPIGRFPVEFLISPDEQYIAYITGGGGGTCVWGIYPQVFNLKTLSGVKLDDSELKAIELTPQDTEEIKWISNNTLEAKMVFGCDRVSREIIQFRIQN